MVERKVTDAFVARDHRRCGVATVCGLGGCLFRQDYGRDFHSKVSCTLRGGGTSVRLEGVGILLGAGDGESFGNSLGGHAHVPILRGAPESVADDGVDGGGVVHADAAARPREEVGGAGHGLHAACDDNAGVARSDGLGLERDRFQTGTADHVEGGGGDGVAETTAQSRLARGVLAQPCGEDASHEALVDLRRSDRSAGDCFAHGDRSQVGCGERSERALKFSNGRTHCGDDDDPLRFIVHGNSSSRRRVYVPSPPRSSRWGAWSCERACECTQSSVAAVQPGIFSRKKKRSNASIFLDTEFHQIYTSVSCNFTVAVTMSY